MIEAVDGMPILEGFGRLGFAAAEIADDIAAPLPVSGDHFFVRNEGPTLAGLVVGQAIPRRLFTRMRRFQPRAMSAAAAKRLHEENRGDR